MTSTSIYTSAIPVSQSKTEQYISKAKDTHGELYNYSETFYVKSNEKVKIICKTHGVFEQKIHAHINGARCPKCFGNQYLTTKEFIVRAEIIHGNTYNYDLVDYINMTTKVKIECKLHGIFEQTPHSHLKDTGCTSCGYMSKYTLEEKKAIVCVKAAKRRASKLKATPKWIELDLIKQLYIQCRVVSESTGIEHHVDHIVPLISDIVCGLHCISNLRILSRMENSIKGNRYWPDMWQT